MRTIYTFIMVWFMGMGVLPVSLIAGNTQSAIKTAHSDIGRDLIKIKHECPQLQDRVYTILDEVGTLYRLAMQTVQKRKQMKLLAMQEAQTVRSLKTENKELTQALSRTEQANRMHAEKCADANKRVSELEHERSTILEQQLEVEKAASEQQERIQLLEGALAKNSKEPAPTAQNKNMRAQATTAQPMVVAQTNAPIVT